MLTSDRVARYFVVYFFLFTARKAQFLLRKCGRRFMTVYERHTHVEIIILHPSTKVNTLE